MILEHETQLQASGWIEKRRTLGAVEWLNDLISMSLGEMFRAQPAVAERLPALRKEVGSGRTTALAATRELMLLFRPPTE
jgi:LAO/AO transport system kinase